MVRARAPSPLCFRLPAKSPFPRVPLRPCCSFTTSSSTCSSVLSPLCHARLHRPSCPCMPVPTPPPPLPFPRRDKFYSRWTFSPLRPRPLTQERTVAFVREISAAHLQVIEAAGQQWAEEGYAPTIGEFLWVWFQNVYVNDTAVWVASYCACPRLPAVMHCRQPAVPRAPAAAACVSPSSSHLHFRSVPPGSQRGPPAQPAHAAALRRRRGGGLRVPVALLAPVAAGRRRHHDARPAGLPPGGKRGVPERQGGGGAHARGLVSPIDTPLCLMPAAWARRVSVSRCTPV